MRLSLRSQIVSVDFSTVFVGYSCVTKRSNKLFQYFLTLFAPILFPIISYRLLLIHLRLKHCFIDRQYYSAKSFLTVVFPYGQILNLSATNSLILFYVTHISILLSNHFNETIVTFASFINSSTTIIIFIIHNFKNVFSFKHYKATQSHIS